MLSTRFPSRENWSNRALVIDCSSTAIQRVAARSSCGRDIRRKSGYWKLQDETERLTLSIVGRSHGIPYPASDLGKRRAAAPGAGSFHAPSEIFVTFLFVSFLCSEASVVAWRRKNQRRKISPKPLLRCSKSSVTTHVGSGAGQPRWACLPRQYAIEFPLEV